MQWSSTGIATTINSQSYLTITRGLMHRKFLSITRFFRIRGSAWRQPDNGDWRLNLNLFRVHYAHRSLKQDCCRRSFRASLRLSSRHNLHWRREATIFCFDLPGLYFQAMMSDDDDETGSFRCMQRITGYLPSAFIHFIFETERSLGNHTGIGWIKLRTYIDKIVLKIRLRK